MQGYWYYSSYFSFVHSRNKASLSLLYWFGSHSSENIRLLSLLWWTVLCVIITGCITFLAWLVGVIGATTGGVFPCAAKLWIFCVQMFSFGVWSELLKVNFFKTAIRRQVFWVAMNEFSSSFFICAFFVIRCFVRTGQPRLNSTKLK